MEGGAWDWDSKRRIRRYKREKRTERERRKKLWGEYRKVAQSYPFGDIQRVRKERGERKNKTVREDETEKERESRGTHAGASGLTDCPWLKREGQHPLPGTTDFLHHQRHQ